MLTTANTADVIVVGAGPAGATTAYYLAKAGLDVLLLEKASFPRDKVCGDGLTPRAVRQLVRMGIDTSAPGWIKNKGLRIIGGGMRLHMPWPELASYPNYGLVRARMDFDELLARHAENAGARLHEGTQVTEPVVDERTGRIIGVKAKVRNHDSRRSRPGGSEARWDHRTNGNDGPASAPTPMITGASTDKPVHKHDGKSAGDHGTGSVREVEFRAPLVVAADGVSSRLATSMGVQKRDDRPMGVAVRAYYKTDRHDDDWMESWLELWDGQDLLPGYGWIFGTGNGTSNVGLGVLNSSAAFGRVDYKDLLRRWVAQTPEHWGFTEENQVGQIRSAALPMAFNRQPHYTDGLLLVGDAGGMVNPFNGEGIDYAMEAAALAAHVITDASAHTTAAGRERVLQGYPRALKHDHGGYYTLGRIFVKLIGDPRVMKLCTRHGLPHPVLMRFTLKLLANLTDKRDGDAMDRIINTLTRLAPAA